VIRINLVRVKKSRRAPAGQRQLLYMGMAVLVTIGGLVFVHIQASGELEGLQQENRRVQADIDRLKAEIGDYDKVKAQREELLKQRKSIQALEAGRAGPVFLLRELSEILTPGKGPTFDKVTYEEALRRDPNVGFNASWDTHRAWIESYEENQKKVRIRGAAKSNDDAAEFMKRLNSSVFFSGVRLENTVQSQDRGGLRGGASSALKHITFSLNAEVVY
jgi:type IV pilus assembly protein PilN